MWGLVFTLFCVLAILLTGGKANVNLILACVTRMDEIYMGFIYLFLELHVLYYLFTPINTFFAYKKEIKKMEK